MRLIDADVLMPNAEYKGRYDVVTAYDIANAPTVKPEPRKKGKWIYGEKSCQEDFKTCPFCDLKMVSYTGADMREGEEE